MKQVFFLTMFSFLSTFVFSQTKPQVLYEVGSGCGFLIGNHNLSPRGVIYRDSYKGASPSFYGKANYILKNNMLVGLKYHSFFTTGDYFTETLNRVTENITAHYIAPQIGYTYPINPKLSLSMNTGVGYLYYRNTGLENGTEYNIHSNMVGGNTDLAVEYFLKDKFSVGLNTAYFGSLYSDKIRDNTNKRSYSIEPEDWNKIRINKVDFSLFFRIHI